MAFTERPTTLQEALDNLTEEDWHAERTLIEQALVRPGHQYGERVTAFVDRMFDELDANEHKGGVAGWQGRDWESAIFEIVYHTLKLALAVRNRKPGFAHEYAADVANLAFMISDKVESDVQTGTWVKQEGNEVDDYMDEGFEEFKQRLADLVAMWFQPPPPALEGGHRTAMSWQADHAFLVERGWKRGRDGFWRTQEFGGAFAYRNAIAIERGLRARPKPRVPTPDAPRVLQRRAGPSQVLHGDTCTVRLYLRDASDPQVYDDCKHVFWQAGNTVLTILQTFPEDGTWRYVSWMREQLLNYQTTPTRFEKRWHGDDR